MQACVSALPVPCPRAAGETPSRRIPEAFLIRVADPPESYSAMLPKYTPTHADQAARLRQTEGATPNSRLKARLKAASDS